ncbi:MAG: hypothetical protein NTX88_00620 [Candidatus Atribacteria bacterium]|nr:hypothetical protein [Candidatus Atribacteria bacterium]
MKRKNELIIVLVSSLIFSLLAGGCALLNLPSSSFILNGTVLYVDLEGGFYGINGDDGQRYDPANLPADFKKDGLRIHFEARIKSNQENTHMWGKSIEIVSIVVADTGMQGKSVMGPMCPASQSGTSCPDKPYQATIIVHDRLGWQLTKIYSDAQGFFEYYCAPGTYILSPVSSDGYQHAPEQTITVVQGEITQVTITFDSGIR